jgi:hypothetical protein
VRTVAYRAAYILTLYSSLKPFVMPKASSALKGYTIPKISSKRKL